MSIAHPMHDITHPRVLDLRIEPLKPDQSPRKRAAVPVHPSPRRIEANRNNARKSTGPRTPEGKERSKMNALKHGLTAATPILPGECEATFEIFLLELDRELQPRSIMQKHLLPQIARQLWKLQRLPGAEQALMQTLAASAGDDVQSWPELLARCFETGDSSPLLRLERYERGIQHILLRLMNQYYWLKKHHPTTPPDPDEQRRELLEHEQQARRREQALEQEIREQRQRKQQKRQAAAEKRRQRARQRNTPVKENPDRATSQPMQTDAHHHPPQNEPTTPPPHREGPGEGPGENPPPPLHHPHIRTESPNKTNPTSAQTTAKCHAAALPVSRPSSYTPDQS